MLLFETREWEESYSLSLFKNNFRQEILTYIIKVLIDSLLVAGVLYGSGVTNGTVYAVSLLILFLLNTTVLLTIKYLSEKNINIVVTIIYCSLYISLFFLFVCGPLGILLLYREAQVMSFAVLTTIAFNSRLWQYRIFLSFLMIYYMLEVAQNFFYIKKKEMDLNTYVADGVMIGGYCLLYVFHSHRREMISRRNYNNSRIVNVEIKNIEDSL